MRLTAITGLSKSENADLEEACKNPEMRVEEFRGKRTLFYNGEKLFDDDTGEYLIYNEEERNSWEVMIVLPGVEVIPDRTFMYCRNVKTVIMADTVRRIEMYAFNGCYSLSYVKLSTSLECIGMSAFWYCESLTPVFIPPSCREIDHYAFHRCTELIIFHVPQHTTLGEGVVINTALIRRSFFETYEDDGIYGNFNEVNGLIKNINGDNDEYALHRACSSYNPLDEVIHGIVTRQGLKAFHKKNEIGITPLQYLHANPFADISQSVVMKRYVLDMMGEVV